MDTIVATSVRYILIIGVINWLLQTNAWNIRVIPLSIAKIGAKIAGVSTPLSLGTIIETQIDILTPLYNILDKLSWLDLGMIIILTITILLLNILFFMMSATVFCVNLEIVFIQTAGLLTISFLFIPYFKDMFVGYLKGLAGAALKLALMTMVLGMVHTLLQSWVTEANNVTTSGTGSITLLISMVSAAMVFYMLLNAVPGFAHTILSGQPSGFSGSALTGAAMAGAGLAMTAYGMARSGVKAAQATGSTIRDAARAYESTSQAVRDAGGSAGKARIAGAKEALLQTLGMGGSGGPTARANEIRAESARKNGATGAGIVGTNTMGFANGTTVGIGGAGNGGRIANATGGQSQASHGGTQHYAGGSASGAQQMAGAQSSATTGQSGANVNHQGSLQQSAGESKGQSLTDAQSGAAAGQGETNASQQGMSIGSTQQNENELGAQSMGAPSGAMAGQSGANVSNQGSPQQSAGESKGQPLTDAQSGAATGQITTNASIQGSGNLQQSTNPEGENKQYSSGYDRGKYINPVSSRNQYESNMSAGQSMLDTRMQGNGNQIGATLNASRLSMSSMINNQLRNDNHGTFWNGLSQETRIKLMQNYGMTAGKTMKEANVHWKTLSPDLRENIYKMYK